MEMIIIIVRGGGGMSLAINKFTHPYSLTHKDYNKEK